MFRLDKLEKLTTKRKRIGRGGSRGGTSGRGHKGQLSRSGGMSGKVSFEGGQMPLIRRLPRRGFVHTPSFEYELVNLRDLESVFEKDQSVDREQLVERGVINGRRGTKVKLLGGGELTKPLKVSVDAASMSAREAVEKAGGTINLVGG